MRQEIKISLDEIEASYDVMSRKSSNQVLSQAKSWIRKNKAILKELKYNGKISRQPKIKKGNLFNE